MLEMNAFGRGEQLVCSPDWGSKAFNSPSDEQASCSSLPGKMRITPSGGGGERGGRRGRRSTGSRRRARVSVTEGMPWPEAATVRPDPAGKYPAADFDHILLSPGWGKNAGRDRWKGCVTVNVNEKPFKVEVVQNKKIPSDHWPEIGRAHV